MITLPTTASRGIFGTRGNCACAARTFRAVLAKRASNRFGAAHRRRARKAGNMSYRLVTYAAAAGPRAGVVIGDEVFDAAKLTGRTGDATVLGLLDDRAAAAERLGKAAPAPGTGERLAGVRLLAPIRWPSAIYCAGANYADHAAEMARLHNRPPEPDPHTLGLKPWHFIKAGRSTLAGPDDTIQISAMSKTMDWEIELAAVIGRTAKSVAVEQALDHVAGYTIANDLSARDMGRRPNVPDA